MANVRCVAFLSAAVLGSAIGTDIACSTRSSKSPSTTPAAMLRVIISADGLRPAAYAGRPVRVEFFNDDSESHRLLADTHPEHGGCPEMMDLGVIPPQRSVLVTFSSDRRQGNIALPVCRYHDETRPDDRRFWGSIVVREE